MTGVKKWLFSAPVDLAVFGGTAAIALILVALLPAHESGPVDVRRRRRARRRRPRLVDRVHRLSRSRRVAAPPRDLRRRADPCFIAGIVLYAGWGEGPFWTDDRVPRGIPLHPPAIRLGDDVSRAQRRTRSGRALDRWRRDLSRDAVPARVVAREAAARVQLDEGWRLHRRACRRGSRPSSASPTSIALARVRRPRGRGSSRPASRSRGAST